MPKIELTGVHVSYPVYTSNAQLTMMSQVARKASFGVLGKQTGGPTWIHALRGVGFQLREGDRLGIIGRNGSGKSTLLKTLCGVTWPQRGSMTVQGKVSSIISLGVGLDPEKTAFENVDFVGRLFELDASARKALMDDVTEFTELGEFLGMPVRTYSAGMLIRLSYALATALPGEILVVDEVLGAGDAIFQGRAAERARSKYDDAKIFVMATHSGEALEEYCNYAIWLDRGQIVDHGQPREMWQRYLDQAPRKSELSTAKRAS